MPAIRYHAGMNHDAPASTPPPVGSLPSSDGAGERGYDSYGIHPAHATRRLLDALGGHAEW